MIEDLNELENKISQWGIDRNITDAGGVTAQDQISKLIEELAECVSTLGKLSQAYDNAQNAFDEVECHGDKISTEQYLKIVDEEIPTLEEKLQDDYGDMIVCIIQAMRMSGTNMVECLNKSWYDIKDRKGQMVGGKFVKEEPLNKKLKTCGEDKW